MREIGSRRVLCVDADAKSVEHHKQMLRGYQVTGAGTAFDALRLMNSAPFHAYVLEQWLPDLAGVLLCREIRKNDPHAPIVFCTAAAREQDRARAMRAGAHAYLVKPIEAEPLLRNLRTCLERSELESLQAKAEAEHAIQDEFLRRFAQVRARVDPTRRLASSSVERTARARAFRAFIEARGTRAYFESWWPQVYASAWANNSVASATSTLEEREQKACPS